MCVIPELSSVCYLSNGLLSRASELITKRSLHTCDEFTWVVAQFQKRGRAQWSSAAGASIEAPKAPREVGCGDGVSPSSQGERSGGNIFLILDLKISTFGASCALFFAVLLPIVQAKTLQCFWACKTCCCLHTDNRRRETQVF